MFNLKNFEKLNFKLQLIFNDGTGVPDIKILFKLFKYYLICIRCKTIKKNNFDCQNIK